MELFQIATLCFLGRPRGRLPGLGGIPPFFREAVALRWLGFSLVPLLKAPRRTAAGFFHSLTSDFRKAPQRNQSDTEKS